jgi:hypothetical protein
MAKVSRDLATPAGGAVNLHPREALLTSGNLAAANAEIVLPSDSCGTVALDLRGTFNLSVEISGTVDGTNWTPIPIRPVNQTAVAYAAAISGSVQGLWVGSCIGYRSVRARCTAFTSGSATATLTTSNAPLDQTLAGTSTPSIGTIVGAAAAAATLTLASPGVGLRHYMTYLRIVRFASAALTASATPVTITTTNLPGSLAFTCAADALQLGQRDIVVAEDFAYPIAASAQNAATTIACPATPGVIWRVTAGFFVAP